MNKPFKYIVYSLFNWLGVFRSKGYQALFLYEHGKLKASMLVVPAYYKWPFMGADDLQFTYVVTDSSERGRGWGTLLLKEGLRLCKKPGRSFWYVTASRNLASRGLAEKLGFVAVGETIRKKHLLYTGLELRKMPSYKSIP